MKVFSNILWREQKKACRLSPGCVTVIRFKKGSAYPLLPPIFYFSSNSTKRTKTRGGGKHTNNVENGLKPKKKKIQNLLNFLPFCFCSQNVAFLSE